MRAASVVSVVSGWVILVSACSGSSSGGGNTAGDPTALACQDYAKAYCAKLDQCSNQAAQRAFGSDDACAARQVERCVTSAAAPGSGATATTIQACTGSLPVATCAEWLEPEPVVCAIAPGSLPVAAACAYGTQCATTYCAVPFGSACGQCAEIPSAGADCSATHGCGPANLRCDLSGKGTCLALGGSGAACDGATPCLAGLDCVGAKAMKPGTCQPSIEMAGAACDPTHDTAAGCNRGNGLTCDKTSMTCVAVLSATAGAACGNDKASGSFTICSGGTVCYTPPTAGAASTCVAAVSEGGACDLVAGPPCLTPARCVTAGGGTAGTCQLVAGASCK